MAQPTSVVDRLRSVLSGGVDRAVLVSENHHWNGAELLRRVDERAAGLPSASVTGVSMPEGPDLVVALLAAMSSGAVAPVRADLPPAALTEHLRLTGATALIAAETGPASEVATRLGLTRPDATGSLPVQAPAGGHPFDPAVVLTTSGTTGEPKVVPLTHANLLASCSAVRASLGLGHEDRSLLVMPLTHIHGLVAGLLAPLLAGGSVFVAGGFDPRVTPRIAEDFGATYVTAVPTIHHHLARLTDGELGWARHLRFLRSSSSALPLTLSAALTARYRVPVVEAYGMTEAAHQITSNRPDSPCQGTVGAIDPDRVRVVDDADVPVEAGEPGKVQIRGSNVIGGYLGSAEVNEGAFVDGWFRTGDVGVIDDDGHLRLVGRTKEMINRGGESIAPIPIEEVIRSCAGVRDVVVFSEPHEVLGEQVAAAVVADDEGIVITDIQNRVAAALGPAQVPRVVRVVPSIPLGPTGKVQRSRLADLLSAPEPARRSDGQLSDEERVVAEVWRSVGLEARAADDDFIALGGDSLLAIEVADGLSDRWGTDVHPADLLVDTTLRGHVAARAVTAAGRTEVEGLSPIERRFLAAHRMSVDEGAGHMVFGWRIEGALDPQQLHRGLLAVIERHPSLRTVYPAARERQVRNDARQALAWTTGTAVSIDEAGVVLAALASEPYDLGSGPLVRGGAWRCGGDQWLVGLAYHHLVLDGRSRRVVLDDWATAYAGELDGDPIPVTRPTFRSLTDQESAWWRRRLGGIPPRLDWPAPSDVPSTVRKPLAPDQLVALEGWARTERVTLTMMLVAAVAALAHTETGGDRIIVGLPIEQLSSRDRPGAGVTIDTVPVVVEVAAGDTLADLVARTRQACVESYRRADAGLQYIRLAAGLPPGVSSLHVEAQVRRTSERLQLAGLEDEVVPIDPLGARSGVVVDLDLGFATPTLVVTAAAQPAAVERWADLVEQVLTAMTTDPGRTVGSLLAPEVTPAPAPTPTPPPRHATVDGWFRAMVAADPSRRVLSAGDRVVDRGQLADLVVAAAKGLSAVVPPGGCVLSELPRSVELIALQLAGWRAGVIVIAIEPTDPPSHRARLRAVAHPDLIVHEHHASVGAEPGTTFEDLLDAGSPAPTPTVDPGAPAWGCFTSGSTGQPELVLGTQSNLVHLAESWLRGTSLGEGDTAMSSKPVSSVGFLSEWLVPVLSGATVRLFDDVAARDPAHFATECEAHAVSWLRAAPAILDSLCDHLLKTRTQLPEVRVVVAGADTLTRGIADRIARTLPEATLINQYGCTETTSEVTLGVVSPGRRDPDVGHPLDAAIVDLVDDDGAIVPHGSVGEIRISGPLVAGGGTHLTGDYGRFDRSGRLHFLGRRDRRLSVHGHRVEAAEIEAALRSTGLVRDAVVAAPAGAVEAVVVAEGQAGPADIRRALRERYPRRFVPREISVVSALVHTRLGKVDVDASLARAAPPRIAPAGPVDELDDLAAAAAVVLGRSVETVDRAASLADNGGDSFSAIELAERLSVISGTTVGVDELLDDRPLSDLVHLTRPRSGSSPGPGRLRRISAGVGSTPLIWFPGGGGLLVEVHRLAHYLDRQPPLFAHPYVGTEPGERPRIGMGRLVRRALDDVGALDVQGVVVGGNSYGGLVAASFASAAQRRSPGSVRGLVLIDALPIEERRRVKPPWWSSRTRRDLLAHWRDRPDPSDSSATRWQRTFRGSRLSAAGMRRSPKARGFPVVVIGTAERRGLTGRDDLGWGRHLDVVAALPIPGQHGGLLVEPMVSYTAPAVDRALDLILGPR